MSAIAPEDLEKINLETAEADAETYERGVRQSLEEGWAVWRLGPPQKRLRGYIACTWPEDLLLLKMENYIDLYHAEVLPPLRAMVEWQKITTPEPDGKGGMTIPQPSDYRPFVWALWAICPPYVFSFFQEDFRKLLKAESEKQAAV